MGRISQRYSDMGIISLRDISKIYHLGKNELRVLHSVDLDIDNGEYVAVMGPSGAGKSTLLHILGLLTKPTSGSYLLDGESATGLTPKQAAVLRNRKIGFIFQDFQLIEWGTSLYNVMVPLNHSSVPRKERGTKAVSWLERLGLGHRLQHRPKELSGGEKQRVAIARAMVMDPVVLLADEATGNLDVKRGREILNIFEEINELGRTIVHVTHNREVAEYARRTVRIVDGRIV
jgi:putative ABC transport system ATP-binding protein